MTDKTLNGKSFSISLRYCESACWYSWSSKGTCTDLAIGKLRMDRLCGNQGHEQFLGKISIGQHYNKEQLQVQSDVVTQDLRMPLLMMEQLGIVIAYDVGIDGLRIRHHQIAQDCKQWQLIL